MEYFLQTFLSTTDFLQDWYIYNANSPLLFNSALFLVLFLIFYSVYIKLLKKKELRTVYVIVFSLFFITNLADIILGYYFFRQ